VPFSVLSQTVAQAGKSFPVRPLAIRVSVSGPFNEKDILSDDAIDGSKARDRRHKPKPEAHVFLKDGEIDELVRRAKGGNRSARDRLILAARPLLARIASKYASIHVPADELIVQGIIGTPGEEDENGEIGEITNGLFYALDKFDPDKAASSSPSSWRRSPGRC
jgi:hypothetical protein